MHRRGVLILCISLAATVLVAGSADAKGRGKMPVIRFQMSILNKSGKPYQGYVALSYRQQRSNTHVTLRAKHPRKGGGDWLGRTDRRGVAHFYTYSNPRMVRVENFRLEVFGKDKSKEVVTVKKFARPHATLFTASARLTALD